MRLMRRGNAAANVHQGPEWARGLGVQAPGCASIGSLQPRHPARVVGVVGSIRVVPRAEVTRLEITISDGTGEISGVWFGHHKIGGLDLGERVIFEGMVGSPGQGKLEILHPTYQLLGSSTPR